MQVSVVWTINAKSLSLDKAIENLTTLRDEGFRRVWSTQMPNEPDVLTAIAVAGREVPTSSSAPASSRSSHSIR